MSLVLSTDRSKFLVIWPLFNEKYKKKRILIIYTFVLVLCTVPTCWEYWTVVVVDC